MRMIKLSTILQFAAGGACVIALGAAAPSTSSIAPLSIQGDGEAPAMVAKTVTATSANYQAAPMPNQDVSAPPDTSKPDTTLSPKLLSPRVLFQGDGYSYASSEQSSLDGRRAAAAGLGLNVPVQ